MVHEHLDCSTAKPDPRSLKRAVTGAHPDTAFTMEDTPKGAKEPTLDLGKDLLAGEPTLKPVVKKEEEDHAIAHPIAHPANAALSQASKHDIDDTKPAHPAQLTAAKTQAAAVHSTHPSLDKLHPKSHKEPEDVSAHPAHHTVIHVANAHKALETSSKKPAPKKEKEHLDDAASTMAALHTAAVTIKSKTPAKASEPHHIALKEAESHIEQAKTDVEQLNAAQNDVKVKSKKVSDAVVKSAEASHDAHKAAAKSEAAKQAHKEGKITAAVVHKAIKDADDKAKVAHEATAKVVKAETEKKKADIKVAAHKAETKTDVEAAKKLTLVAAKTAKPAEASTTKKTAEDVKKAIGHLEPKTADEHITKVKTDCDFLENAVLLGDLKSMPELDPVYSCVGFGGHIDDGEMRVAAIKCKPMADGQCPTSYDDSLCKVVPLDVNKVVFKSLF